MAIESKRRVISGNRLKYEPFASHYFEVDIDGIYSGRFLEITGLSGSAEVYEIKEGGNNTYPHKFVTRTSYGDITLKRGFFSNPELFGWFQRISEYTGTDRKNGSISLKAGKENKSVATWNFRNAFPIKWEGPSFNAKQSALSVESVTLAVEHVSMLVSPY